jgi:hypothetical protein
LELVMTESEREVTRLVLTVHRRNRGQLQALDLRWRLLEPSLLLDSLDLAEIVAALERRFAVSVFDGRQTPITWADVVRALARPDSPTTGCEPSAPTDRTVG